MPPKFERMDFAIWDLNTGTCQKVKPSKMLAILDKEEHGDPKQPEFWVPKRW